VMCGPAEESFRGVIDESAFAGMGSTSQ